MRRPPRLAARTMAVTFITVAVILSLVFGVLMVDARERVRAAELEKLSVAERVFTALEARHRQEELAVIAILAGERLVAAGAVGAPFQDIAALPRGTFRISSAPLRLLDRDTCVQALVTVLPLSTTTPEPALQELLGRHQLV